ncbi:MAG: hypothetical protein U0411_09430 [Thermodesulfovibrionales bacterium]
MESFFGAPETGTQKADESASDVLNGKKILFLDKQNSKYYFIFDNKKVIKKRKGKKGRARRSAACGRNGEGW